MNAAMAGPNLAIALLHFSGHSHTISNVPNTATMIESGSPSRQ
jgi:hypothetical protein